jgi:predicted ATPase
MMSLVVDPRQSPELLFLRESIRAWRFYDHFRTDAEAPARAPQLGTYTPILVNDGSDLAAAIQTVLEIGDAEALRVAVEDAFPKSTLELEVNAGRFSLLMMQHGLLRSLSMAEVSDGTLRYLLWIAALLTPRPPELMVLNEPETSLHPDLLPALARLIVRASERCQMIVVSHAGPLIDALNQQSACHSIVLEKDFGETKIQGTSRLNKPVWHWPQR